MDIILLRHGHAVDIKDVDASSGLGDAGRWLSGKGRKRTRDVSDALTSRKKDRPVEIWTSPLVRAVQTAEIAAGAARLTNAVYVRAELSPGRDPAEAMRLLADFKGRGPLLVVGHEPSLSMLAALLLGARSYPSLKKSGVVALSWEGHGKAKIRFELQPKALKGGQSKA